MKDQVDVFHCFDWLSDWSSTKYTLNRGIDLLAGMSEGIL